MSIFTNVEDYVVKANLGANAHQECMTLQPAERVCRCNNHSTAFFLAAALNGLTIGDLWENWIDVNLPWSTDASNEFIYDRRGRVVTRIMITDSQIIESEEEHNLPVEERKASLVLKKIKELYN